MKNIFLSWLKGLRFEEGLVSRKVPTNFNNFDRILKCFRTSSAHLEFVFLKRAFQAINAV